MVRGRRGGAREGREAVLPEKTFLSASMGEGIVERVVNSHHALFLSSPLFEKNSED